MSNGAIEYFRACFGEGDCYKQFSSHDAQRLEARISPLMQEILVSDGWSSYRDQVLWLCDPDEWLDVAKLWFGPSKNLTPIARSAFGDLYVWDDEWIWNVRVHESVVMRLIDNVDWFLSQTITSDDFATQTHLKHRTANAFKSEGAIAYDEMYTYVPSIALGGDQESSDISIVKAYEGISILAGLAPIQFIS
jgi:hypothetical protein